MTIEVKAYRCQFHVNGCRKQLILSQKRMEAHEAACIANPANRTCKTCAHDLTIREEWDGPICYTGENWCDHHEHKRTGGFERNCPAWEQAGKTLEAMKS